MSPHRPLPARLSPTPVRVVRRRVARSEIVRDISRHGWLPLWCALLLVVAFLIGLASGDFYVTWGGVERIPTELPPSSP